jgi:hypothetical protein
MADAPRVLAIDLSLTATGLAGNWPKPWTETYKPKTAASDPHGRLHEITGAVYGQAARGQVDLAIIEGPSYGSAKGQRGHHERAGLWWNVTWRLWRNYVPLLVMTPGSVKVYATGNGGASKDDVLVAAVNRWPLAAIANNNEADAFTMLAAALDRAGVPLCGMPKTHRRTLPAINAWPSRAAA